jgi:hypothetical protein
MTMLAAIAAGPLNCPDCGFNYLHHDRVTIYDRGEDAERTIRTEVNRGHAVTALLPSAMAENPSSRRDGLSIRFWCEGCPATPELTIAQHKGQTFLAWRSTV